MTTHRVSAKSKASVWVHLPIGQQRGGAWVDELANAGRMATCGGSALARGGAANPRNRIEVFRGSDLEARVNAVFGERGWTDGLPIVVPTMARVREMMRFSPAQADVDAIELEPLRGIATFEKIAINAVMAGCRPEYLPVVVAAVRAIADPRFNLRGVQTTDENVTPLLVVSGPITWELNINSGMGALGPGWQANATIGRALRLVMANIGGGWPGVVSMAGIGQPARYTLCVAENHARSPWPGLQVEAGLAEEQSAVTVLRAESCITVTGELDDIASVMGSAASVYSTLHRGCIAVLLAPQTVSELARNGWGKDRIAAFLYERGRIPVEQWRRLWVRNRIATTYGLPERVRVAEECNQPIPIVEGPEDIVLFVAGGDAPITQHAYFPTWGFPHARIVVPISLPANWRALHLASRGT